MKFPYLELTELKTLSSKRRLILRPLVDIIVIHNDIIVGYECLVDSGSDYNIFDEKLAKILNINVESGEAKVITGIGKKVIKGYKHRLDLRFVGRSFMADVLFCKDTSQDAMGILGNQGFFDKFDVNFRYSEKYFEVN